MTVTNQTVRWRYTGDDATTSFVYTNKVNAAGEILVYLDGVLQGSGYSVAGVGVATGGNVVFSSAPAAGVQVDLVRKVLPVQGASLPTAGALPAKKVEGMLDLVTMVLQDQFSLSARSLRLSVDAVTSGVSLEIPSLVANKQLAVNSSGDGLEWAGAPAEAVPVGGTTGQVLRKASDTNYDTEWFTLGALAALATVGTVQIDPAAVTNAKLAAMAQATIKGRAAGAGSGDPQDLTAAQLLAILLTADGAGSGLDADLLDGNEASAFEQAVNKGNANGYASLDGSGKVPTSELPSSVVGGVAYQGNWNASTNSPALSSGVGSQGNYYVVSVDGSTNLDGIADWKAGDWAIYNGSVWEKVDNTDLVASVFGRVGTVTAQSGDYNADQISETASNKIMTSAERTKLAGIASGAEVNPAVPSQAQAEDGSSTAEYSWTPQRVHQAAKDAVPVTLIVAVGDETTALTIGTGKVSFRLPHAMTLTGVRASLTTASSSGLVTVDINEGGVTILSTKLSIDANEKTSATAATAAVISDSSLADDAEITIDIDAAGTNAAGLKVTLIGYKTTT